MTSNFSPEEQTVADAFAGIGIDIHKFEYNDEGIDITMTQNNGHSIAGAVLDEAQQIAGPEYTQPTRDEIAQKVNDLTGGGENALVEWIDEQINAANAAGYTEGYEDADSED